MGGIRLYELSIRLRAGLFGRCASVLAVAVTTQLSTSAAAVFSSNGVLYLLLIVGHYWQGEQIDVIERGAEVVPCCSL